MVTTRSADKRLDTAREELVLRSRTIGSPSSVSSTPTQSQKRTANSRESIDSLRSKRVRTESSGTNSNKSSHVVVNIPVKSIHHENDPIVDGLIKGSSSRAATQTEPESDSTTDDDRDQQTTPNAKVPISAETPEPGSEAFKTPATSRHKRFDSEELDDDTILVNTAIDSSAPQGYQTAEEEIADSDDDGAPAIESTKIESKLPRRKSARTSREKAQSTSTLNTIDVDEEIIQVIPSQTEIESLTVEKESPMPESEIDQVASEGKPGQELFDDTSLASSILEPSNSQTTIGSTPAVHNALPVLPQITSPPINQDLVFAGDADVESVTVSDSTLQDISLNARTDAPRIESFSGGNSGAMHRNFFPLIPRRSTEIHKQSSNFAPMSNTARLPARTTSSLSDYRRRKFQQKVAGSAGGFKLQNNWQKKRGSFVVS